jgi:hypothetical protein
MPQATVALMARLEGARASNRGSVTGRNVIISLNILEARGESVPLLGAQQLRVRDGSASCIIGVSK